MENPTVLAVFPKETCGFAHGYVTWQEGFQCSSTMPPCWSWWAIRAASAWLQASRESLPGKGLDEIKVGKDTGGCIRINVCIYIYVLIDLYHVYSIRVLVIIIMIKTKCVYHTYIRERERGIVAQWTDGRASLLSDQPSKKNSRREIVEDKRIEGWR